MPPLGALSQTWTSAEASQPLGWQISDLYRFDELWVALGEEPAFEDYASGSGKYAEQALRPLSGRLRERQGSGAGQPRDEQRRTRGQGQAWIECSL